MRAFNSPELNQQDIQDLLQQIESCKSVSDVRVLQTRLLFVNGLVSEVASSEVLELGEYMGQYGRICKTTFSKVKENFYSAFVEYQSEAEAALALLALDNFLFRGKVVKVFYGSTKYCFSFLKGEECRVRQCAFSHNYQRKYTYFKKNTSSIDHSKIAQRVLETSMRPAPRQISHPKFPSPWKVLDTLIGREKQRQKQKERQREKQKQNISNEKQNPHLSPAESRSASSDSTLREQEWTELQQQIISFDRTEEDRKDRKRTKVQEFLEYAEEKLHSLIFKNMLIDYDS